MKRHRQPMIVQHEPLLEPLTKIEVEAGERDGERVARWIVDQVRAKLDRGGVASFHHDPEQGVPSWFKVGIEYLHRQTAEWVVTIHDGPGRREYRLHRMVKPKEAPL